MKLTRLYEIIFHMQDSSKFYTYWFALSAIYISEKQKPRLSLIFQTGFFCSLNYYQETWVDCSHGVENEQNVHQEFKWCDTSTVTLTSILIWVANWKVWREHGQNFFFENNVTLEHPRSNLHKFRNYASLIFFILIRS